MGVSKNSGVPQDMDGPIMENPMKNWVIWGYHWVFGNTHNESQITQGCNRFGKKATEALAKGVFF